MIGKFVGLADLKKWALSCQACSSSEGKRSCSNSNGLCGEYGFSESDVMMLLRDFNWRVMCDICPKCLVPMFPSAAMTFLCKKCGVSLGYGGLFEWHFKDCFGGVV